jgi:hypothetical protein
MAALIAQKQDHGLDNTRFDTGVPDRMKDPGSDERARTNAHASASTNA